MKDKDMMYCYRNNSKNSHCQFSRAILKKSNSNKSIFIEWFERHTETYFKIIYNHPDDR